VLARGRNSMMSSITAYPRAQWLTRGALSAAAMSVVLLGAKESNATIESTRSGAAQKAPARGGSSDQVPRGISGGAAAAMPGGIAPVAPGIPDPATPRTAATATKETRTTSATPAPATGGTTAPAATPSAATPAGAAGLQADGTRTKILGLATDGVAAVPAFTPAEKRAAALASDAMNHDFLAMTYDNAEKKLRRAVEICLAQQGCSVRFLARLHRDIGVVYIVGMNRIEDGKDEFATALSADSTVAIASESNTDEVETAFLEVKRALTEEQESGTAQPRPKRNLGLASDQASAHSAGKATPAPGADAWRSVANWVSFGVQQDFMVHSATQYVCNDNTRYRCYDAQNTVQNFTTGRTVVKGNEISSSGIMPATLRIMVGYERLLSKNFSIGLKLGMAVHGKAPRVLGAPPFVNDPAFVAFHGEGRLTLYPGAAPFAPTKVVRPYLFVSGGIAEVDGKISVEVFEQTSAGIQSGRVLAWKRSGSGFLGIGPGLAFALGSNHGPFIEARFMQMLGKPAYVVATQGGYAVGF
jgi:hypothetical protein